MVLSHFGVAVAILGMASNAAYTREALVAARPGDGITLGGFTIAFEGVEPVAGPNWTAIQGNFTAVRGDGAPYRLPRQARPFPDRKSTRLNSSPSCPHRMPSFA